MAVSVVTLFLIYVLVVLVVAILLYIPKTGLHNHALIATLFALIVGAVVITLVPVAFNNPNEVTIYNMLLIGSYLLPIIVLIVIGSSLDQYRSYKREETKHVGDEFYCEGDICTIPSR